MRAGSTAVCFLRGGFQRFQACCPDLCSEAPAQALSPAGAENNSSDPRVPIYDQGGPVEILPYLYLGSCSHSSDLQGLQACGITAVLNVSASCPNHFEGLFHYKSIPVEDNQMVEISAWFQEAIGFIDSVKNSGGRVLVHCQAGISRSATICLAYLIQSHRVRLDEAFDFVKQRRGVISPNFSFMGQLLQFETQVQQECCQACVVNHRCPWLWLSFSGHWGGLVGVLQAVNAGLISEETPESSFLVEGDIIRPSPFRLLSVTNNKWPKSVGGIVEIPFLLSSKYDESSRRVIIEAFAEFERFTCIRFVAYQGHRDFISILPMSGERARAVRPAEPGRKAGHRLKESAWIGHCALTEECEIMVCEQERQDTEAAVGATRAGRAPEDV
ncbi:Dual specificity protein phosphatase 2 [Cricetulus griseus]|uniref:Dual specificity protein phosphatase 2 n=1 Tax=Cricetulus griseus TaxID=10029 RepID=G3H033_CRIGR|nr:Dual specificity protein phosphatase 2 [Cricetulus griseus]